MRVAIDASRCTVARVTGTEYYARQLIHHLILANESRSTISNRKPHALTLYFRDEPPQDLFPQSPYVTPKVIPFRRLWTHVRFAHAIWRDKPDITFVPAHTLPFVLWGKGMVTVHDLGYRFFPQAHPLSQRLYLDLTTRYSANRAQFILADSHATQNDLMRLYGISPQKIRVVYPSVHPPHIHIGDIRAKYGLPPRYFVFIGTLQPRKNIARLVQAFARFRQQTNSDIALVLAGGKGWLFDEAWVQNAPNVHLIGYIDEADKGALLANSMGLVFPSLYEGFGFPVLEAMLCGTPVIASNTSSLPELVGEAGLLIDPLDTQAIANAMIRLASDDTLRANLIAKGSAQAQHFDWQTSANTLLDVLDTLNK
jgi:glycosyltransferase involved in cell wall biosynthesis